MATVPAGYVTEPSAPALPRRSGSRRGSCSRDRRCRRPWDRRTAGRKIPCVVRRWHLVLSKKPLSARDLNEFTVCGVFAASIAMAMSPWFVLSVHRVLRRLVDRHLGFGRRRLGRRGGGRGAGPTGSRSARGVVRLLGVVARQAAGGEGHAARDHHHGQHGRDDDVAPLRLLAGRGPALLLPLELLPGELPPPLIVVDHRCLLLVSRLIVSGPTKDCPAIPGGRAASDAAR